MMKKTRVLMCLLTSSVIFSMAAADGYAQSASAAMDEIAILREDLKILQRQMYRANNEVNPTSAADFAVKIGEFDEEIRKMTGRIDELEFKIKGLEDKIDLINKDIDVRIKMLEGKPIAPTASDAGAVSISEAAKSKKFAPKVAADAPKSVTGESVAKGEDLAPVKTKSAEELFEERLLNLVFMGMGEPLDNIDNLQKALAILLDDEAFGFSHRKITVSTSGLISGIKKFFQMETPVNLAVSINAPNEKIRASIMPVTNKNHLNDLIQTLKNVDLDKRKRITLEYVLLGGVNDSLAHAKEFVQLIKGIKAKINLISYNGSPYSEFKTPNEKNVLQFQEYLINNNYTAFIRKKLGQDIAGACGQLAADYKGAGNL